MPTSRGYRLFSVDVPLYVHHLVETMVSKSSNRRVRTSGTSSKIRITGAPAGSRLPQRQTLSRLATLGVQATAKSRQEDKEQSMYPRLFCHCMALIVLYRYVCR
jgi:hypothetical protein